MSTMPVDASLTLFVARTTGKLDELRDACDAMLDLLARADRPAAGDAPEILEDMYRELTRTAQTVQRIARPGGVRP